ncbi:integrase arm-type DNA-binding domain-containing protein [Rhizobium leguminosarum]|uniref:tyrosine-type recombinase/integrase n=1 Tax=Rhizobium leguminosarum TaxID=384 RepID=UPI0013BD176D|nr:site-specific integrase [Rhizobium leguminosarum]NEI57458.1 integrase arm-type DNA-binding domain-containing protein [Rhizobium leguminosarum]NEI86318.1 integrase arm-type DNA-binding domain-containing protein [Rhizobium leguminosarum]
MARNLDLLTAREVSGKLAAGRHSDGGGLYLNVTAAGSKSWAFFYKRDGKRTEMGLGPLDNVPLKTARQMASDAREMLGQGRDPLDERKAAQRAKEEAEREKEAEAAKYTFGVFAMRLLKGYTETDEKGRARWVPGILEGHRNVKHRQQWENTLVEYAAPIWAMKLDEIETDHILRCLAPIWTTKAETAARVRGRIERILAAAIAKGLRRGPNPALLRGHLDALLPKRQRLQRGHHPALPWHEMQGFWLEASALTSISAICLRFTILTAARSGESRGARWNEIDLEKGIWTVPAERMKAGREHVVPLSEAAIAILEEAAKLRQLEDEAGLVFPSSRDRKQLSDMALSMCLRGICEGITVHGFRSSFRDWAGDATPHAREVVEQALAHTIGGVEGAYRRGTAVEKRRGLMADWAAFVTSKPADNIVHLSRAVS